MEASAYEDKQKETVVNKRISYTYYYNNGLLLYIKYFMTQNLKGPPSTNPQVFESFTPTDLNPDVIPFQNGGMYALTLM